MKTKMIILAVLTLFVINMQAQNWPSEKWYNADGLSNSAQITSSIFMLPLNTDEYDDDTKVIYGIGIAYVHSIIERNKHKIDVFGNLDYYRSFKDESSLTTLKTGLNFYLLKEGTYNKRIVYANPFIRGGMGTNFQNNDFTLYLGGGFEIGNIVLMAEYDFSSITKGFHIKAGYTFRLF